MISQTQLITECLLQSIITVHIWRVIDMYLRTWKSAWEARSCLGRQVLIFLGINTANFGQQVLSNSNCFGQFRPRRKGAMRLTLCEALTYETRPDQNTGITCPTLFDKCVGSLTSLTDHVTLKMQERYCLYSLSEKPWKSNHKPQSSCTRVLLHPVHYSAVWSHPHWSWLTNMYALLDTYNAPHLIGLTRSKVIVFLSFSGHFASHTRYLVQQITQ